MDQSKEKSIYEKYGGKPTVVKLVDYFYDELVLKDPTLTPFFKSTDMAQQKLKQQMFFTVAMGGAPKYTGKTMAQSHKGRHIHEEHFNTVVGYVVKTLKVHGVDPEDIEAVGKKLVSHKNDIVDDEK